MCYLDSKCFQWTHSFWTFRTWGQGQMQTHEYTRHTDRQRDGERYNYTQRLTSQRDKRLFLSNSIKTLSLSLSLSLSQLTMLPFPQSASSTQIVFSFIQLLSSKLCSFTLGQRDKDTGHSCISAYDEISLNVSSARKRGERTEWEKEDGVQIVLIT